MTKNYLEKLSTLRSFEDGILFYGMWKGYLEQKDMKDFVDYMTSKGVKLHILHTSGHADADTLDELIKISNPKIIIPIHTENDTWFSRYKNIKIVYSSFNYTI
ncbi:MAG: hypothetical protein J6C82_03735 [Clostridia bacterium]|nr:hypothetical protein [Clostridia bacterium]